MTISIFESGLLQLLRLGLTQVREMQSSDPVLTGAYWVSGALAIILLPLVGWAVDRWGTRSMVLWGLAALLPAARYMPAVFLPLGAVSIVSVASGQLPSLAVANNWFRRRRAVAMSIVWKEQGHDAGRGSFNIGHHQGRTNSTGQGQPRMSRPPPNRVPSRPALSPQARHAPWPLRR